MDSNIEIKAKELDGLLKKKDEYEIKVKEINENLALLQDEFVRLMKDNNIIECMVENVGKIKLSSHLWANIPEENKDIVFKFIESMGEGGLIKIKEPYIHPKTLSGFVNGLIKEGKEVPTGINYGFRESVKIKEV